MRVLVVDDNAVNRYLLTAVLAARGDEVICAEDGFAALEKLRHERVDLMISDVLMPRMDGYRLCREVRLREGLRALPIVLVTAAYGGEREEALAREVGADGFVQRPVEADELIAVADGVVESARRVSTPPPPSDSGRYLAEYGQRAVTQLEHRVVALEAEMVEHRQAEAALRETTATRAQLAASLEDTIEALAATVGRRDSYTARHARRVAVLACALGAELGLDDAALEGLRIAGVVHDFGKVVVPGEVLARPDGLSDDERSLVRTHPEIGHRALEGIAFPWPIAKAVLQHHERLDGSGYPSGLRGGAILPESQILAVADVVEAMASRRPYRAALGLDAALQEVDRNRGRLYDPDVVDACLRLFTERGFTLPA
jgi:response regulator RpfG family c-di-GMP phosphodiesterase